MATVDELINGIGDIEIYEGFYADMKSHIGYYVCPYTVTGKEVIEKAAAKIGITRDEIEINIDPELEAKTLYILTQENQSLTNILYIISEITHSKSMTFDDDQYEHLCYIIGRYLIRQ